MNCSYFCVWIIKFFSGDIRPSLLIAHSMQTFSVSTRWPGSTSGLWVRMNISTVVCPQVGTRSEFVPILSLSSFPSVHLFSQKDKNPGNPTGRNSWWAWPSSQPQWFGKSRPGGITLVMSQVILVWSSSNYNIFFCLEYVSVILFCFSWGSSIIFSSRTQRKPQNSQIRLCGVWCKYVRNAKKAFLVLCDV